MRGETHWYVVQAAKVHVTAFFFKMTSSEYFLMVQDGVCVGFNVKMGLRATFNLNGGPGNGGYPSTSDGEDHTPEADFDTLMHCSKAAANIRENGFKAGPQKGWRSDANCVWFAPGSNSSLKKKTSGQYGNPLLYEKAEVLRAYKVARGVNDDVELDFRTVGTFVYTQETMFAILVSTANDAGRELFDGVKRNDLPLVDGNPFKNVCRATDPVIGPRNVIGPRKWRRWQHTSLVFLMDQQITGDDNRLKPTTIEDAKRGRDGADDTSGPKDSSGPKPDSSDPKSKKSPKTKAVSADPVRVLVPSYTLTRLNC